MIEALFPGEVVALESSAGCTAGCPFPEEQALVKGAGRKRREEFAAGRLLAKRALAHLGIRNFPLIAGGDRVPVWPPEVVGSISHCDGLCGVAVAGRGGIRGIGLDVEVAAPLPGEILDRVCTRGEINWVKSAPPPQAADWFTFFFCAKESLYKAVYPATGEHLDFRDLEVSFLPETMEFRTTFLKTSARDWAEGRSILGRYAWSQMHIGTGVTILGE